MNNCRVVFGVRFASVQVGMNQLAFPLRCRWGRRYSGGGTLVGLTWPSSPSFVGFVFLFIFKKSPHQATLTVAHGRALDLESLTGVFARDLENRPELEDRPELEVLSLWCE